MAACPARSAAAWLLTALAWVCQTRVSAGSAVPRAAPKELSADSTVVITQTSRTTVSTPASTSGGLVSRRNRRSRNRWAAMIVHSSQPAAASTASSSTGLARHDPRP